MEGALPNSFCKTWDQNHTKMPPKKKITVYLVNIDVELLNKILANGIQNYINMTMCSDKVGFISGM